MSRQAVESIATGQVWIADDAKRLGLIDVVRPLNEIGPAIRHVHATQIKSIRHAHAQREVREASRRKQEVRERRQEVPNF